MSGTTRYFFQTENLNLVATLIAFVRTRWRESTAVPSAIESQA